MLPSAGQPASFRSAASVASANSPEVGKRSSGSLASPFRDNLDEPVGKPGALLHERRRSLLHVRPEQLGIGFPGKRGLADEALEEDARQRVLIRSSVDRSRADLLGRQVRERAEQLTCPGERSHCGACRQPEVLTLAGETQRRP
jgi:hypothetical protein